MTMRDERLLMEAQVVSHFLFYLPVTFLGISLENRVVEFLDFHFSSIAFNLF